MTRIPIKTTWTGRVIYNRPKHVFTGRDMTRVVIAVNNNNTGTDVNWHAVWQIASHHKVDQIGVLPAPAGGNKDPGFLFWPAWDIVIDRLTRIGELVPGMGWIISILGGIYNYIRRTI